jgi:hypothetical protein
MASSIHENREKSLSLYPLNCKYKGNSSALKRKKSMYLQNKAIRIAKRIGKALSQKNNQKGNRIVAVKTRKNQPLRQHKMFETNCSSLPLHTTAQEPLKNRSL